MERLFYTYQPYIDPDYESLSERINPPRVCIDNDTQPDCTLVKVDSANKNGILLEMVQVLTDLDLVISKSYISSDGGWFMDVFHVTDQLGNKLTDQTLILYIQQSLCSSSSSSNRKRPIVPKAKEIHNQSDCTSLELTGIDRPGIVSEISAVLVELQCDITSAVAWTHNRRWASIIYLKDGAKGGPINDIERLATIKEQLENVVGAHHGNREERSSVRLNGPGSSLTHTDQRLHQLMYSNDDYEPCNGCDERVSRHFPSCTKTHVSIESCKEKGYSVVNVKSRDRPKLLFDTVCALTELQYVVFHAAVGSRGIIAHQEYFIRQKDGCTLDTENQRQKLSKCLIAAIERRVPDGLRLEMCTRNRMGVLSDLTRIFRENALSISGLEIGTHGERVIGSFYVTDTSGHEVDAKTVELVRQEIGGSVSLVHKSSCWGIPASSSNKSSRTSSFEADNKPGFSLGSLLWSHLERVSTTFRPIR